jgi:hypothetical protein
MLEVEPYLPDMQQPILVHKVMKVCYLQDQVLLQEQTFLEIFGLHTKV